MLKQVTQGITTGAKACYYGTPYAALKGRSSTATS